MGERRRKWTKREELALRAGVAKYGFGKWEKIKKDTEFSLLMSGRSNEALKKKWRSLIKERKWRPILKLTPNAKDPSPNRESDVRDASRYNCNALVFEATSTINDGKGAEFIEIFNFIKERYMVRKTFKIQLIYKLNRLVSRKNVIKSYRNSYPVFHGTKKITVFMRHHKKEHRWKRKHRESQAQRTNELLAEEAVREADDEEIILPLALEIFELCIRSEMEFMEKSFAS